MQLFALDNEGHLVFAEKANKHQDYFCLECQQIVRLRGGYHRHTHFYHLSATYHCRQNGKSMAHLQTQFFIQGLLPDGECGLECRFDAINRIADVVWWPKKIIFEIQCSPISAAEVVQRNRDYQSEGYQVVWILHEKKFNKFRLTAAEDLLQDFPHYFTNIDLYGIGKIYDQYSLILDGMRKRSLPELEVDVRQPKEIVKGEPKHSSLILRRYQWPIHFEGDFLDQLLKKDEDFSQHLAKLEEQVGVAKPPFKLFSWFKYMFAKWVRRPYSLFFQAFLERACK